MNQELINRCNTAPSANQKDFKRVPESHIMIYRDHCYDIKKIIKNFTDNWWRKDFRFTIRQNLAISFTTMKRLARKAMDYEYMVENMTGTYGMRE